VPRVEIRGPEDTTVLLEVDESTVFVVGRSPEAKAVPTACDPASRAIEFAKVPGARVSNNHVVVWSQGGDVKIHDVSKNGTWAQLPRNRTIGIPGQEVVLLQLSQSTVAEAVVAGEDPVPPKWVTGAEYAQSMAQSIQRWLTGRELDVRPSLTPGIDSDPSTSIPTRMPLASGHTLELLPSGTTMDDRFWRVLARLWKWVARQNTIYEDEETTRREGMILVSDPIRAAHSSVVAIAEHGASTLLLTGETGAGKERLAEVFHRHSGRSGPLVAVNCAVVDKELLRQELFGSERGAFTGASRRIPGAVERAQGGTLFLDEIGDFPTHLQGILLRFLDNREIATIGRWGEKIVADVRVVAATHQPLQPKVQEGTFRMDLWFRLAVHRVEVPPLRDRWEDVAFYLQGERDEEGRSIWGALSPEARELLRAHAWQGNFRELRGFAERLLAGGLPQSVSEARCRQELERGSLAPLPPSGPTAGEVPPDWSSMIQRSLSAFAEDHEQRQPEDWGDQREWNERYLKPLVFYLMSGASAHPAPANEEQLRQLANRIGARMHADRATAFAQLQRYFQRFHT
jgi:DNA-binding NtrC family response regulator